MPDAVGANQADAPAKAPGRVTELKVSGHLMLLDPGLFCVFQTPNPGVVDDGSGLPGVRLSLPPRSNGAAPPVSISTFRADGWLNPSDDAALVRVEQAPAQILVTIYQSLAHGSEAAPRLQVLRLSPDGQPALPLPAAHAPKAAPAVAVPENAQAVAPAPGDGDPGASPAVPSDIDVVAHVQRTGDVGGKFGDWIGVSGSRLWIEGFGIAPHENLQLTDFEYQAVLGRGWLSPWVEGGKFCGSRGMALPLLGLRVRLRGDAAASYECSYSASFVDGTSAGPVPAGESCESESLAPLEAFQIVVTKLGRAGAPAPEPAEPATAADALAKGRSVPKPLKPAAPLRKPPGAARRR